MIVVEYKDIAIAEWNRLVHTSTTATWFQTPEAYDFFALQPDLFKPFAYGLINDQLPITNGKLQLRAVCCGYITVEKSAWKQCLTRRAITIGGPALANDATTEEVDALMTYVRKELKSQAIYIETRNFNDYSKWRSAFEAAGFDYQPHLNFHVDTSSVEVVEANLGKSRKRDIKTTIRDGVTLVDYPTPDQVHQYYGVLKNLYETKVKTPLFPESFFQSLAKHPDGRLLLTEYNGKIIGGTVCMVFNRDKFEIINNKSEITTLGGVVYEWFVCGEDGVYPHIFPYCYATYAGIRYAAEHDCLRFDMMGAGTPDEAYGVRDFKAKFGGAEVEHGRFLCITKPLLYKIGVMGVKVLKKLK